MTKSTLPNNEDRQPINLISSNQEQSSLRTSIDGLLNTKNQTKMARGEAIADKMTGYQGRERIEDLDQEIERLYREVESEFTTANGQRNKDAEVALKTLQEAQNIVFEDRRSYNEALHRIAIVRTMIARKRNLKRWSYTWGLFIFGYALVVGIILLVGFLLTDFVGNVLGVIGENVTIFRAAWFSILAGGVGSVVGMLYDLYQHVAIKQDFDRQYVRNYLTQPIKGLGLGLAAYFIIVVVFFVANFVAKKEASHVEILSATSVIWSQIIFSWIAGFRSDFIPELIIAAFEKLWLIVRSLNPWRKGN